jgi:hypothetical protein
MKNIKVTVKNVKAKQMEVSPKKLAVEFEYNPAIRVCVPITNGDEDIFDVQENARKLVLEKVRTWTKEEIIDWVLENEADYFEAYESYDAEYDED